MRFASVNSVNSFHLGFPYEGNQRGRLTVRTHPRYGTDVIIMIDKGQILCDFRGCSFQVRFDEAQSQAWSMSEPESRDSTMLFVNNKTRFIQQLRSSKRVRVEVLFYQQPSITLDFDVSEFDYDRWQGKAPVGAPAQATRPESQGRS